MSQEDKFTPGPWILEKKAPHGFYVLNTLDLKHDLGLIIIHKKEDAELIAHAPDLLRENQELKKKENKIKELLKHEPYKRFMKSITFEEFELYELGQLLECLIELLEKP